jgi:hypothetical protein
MLEAVRDRPPPLAVIRGAVGGVWLGFEEVYGVKWKKCEKLVKKGRQNFLGREFWRLVCVLKKGRQIFWPPPFQISKYATDCFSLFIGRPLYIFIYQQRPQVRDEVINDVTSNTSREKPTNSIRLQVRFTTISVDCLTDCEAFCGV